MTDSGGVVENLDSVWQIGIIALLIGLLAGILAQRLFARSGRETEALRQARDSAQQELEQYRDSVNQHFDKTSELVNDLTQNYVRVYQHLAEGAQTLGDSKTLNNLLEQQPGRVSIAVDENTRTTREVAPETIVATSPVEPVDEHAEAFNAAAAPDVAVEKPAEESADGKVDEPAERAADTDGESAQDESERDQSVHEAAATNPATVDAPAPAKNAKTSGDGAEPVLNVDALGEALEKSGDQAETAAPPADEPDKPGSRATTH